MKSIFVLAFFLMGLPFSFSAELSKSKTIQGSIQEVNFTEASVVVKIDQEHEIFVVALGSQLKMQKYGITEKILKNSSQIKVSGKYSKTHKMIADSLELDGKRIY